MRYRLSADHVLAAVLLLAACGGGEHPQDGGRTVAPSDVNLLTLRLTDLPRGFRAGDDRGCGLGVEGASERLAAFVLDERPDACLAQFELVWPARPGVPALVESNAIVFKDSAGADRALDLRADLLDYTLGLGEIEDEGDVPGLGEEAVAFSTGMLS